VSCDARPGFGNVRSPCSLDTRAVPRLLLAMTLLANPIHAAPLPPASSGNLQTLVDSAVTATLARFATNGLKSNQLAVTVVDLRDAGKPVAASHRGEVQIYPASVVKMFYLAAAHRWMEDGKLADTPELRRALRDMIVESYNEATHYIIDVLTETTSGPELSDAAIDEWWEKRNAVNRYFSSLSYTNINANKKPWCEGPYGRETQSIKRHKPNRNLLTTDATARLMAEIATGKSITPARSAQMMELMKRDPFTATGEPDDQATGFSGRGVPAGAKLWSKAGWTSQTRQDAAYIELPNGAKFVIVIFTTEHANEREIIPSVVRHVAEGLGR